MEPEDAAQKDIHDRQVRAVLQGDEMNDAGQLVAWRGKKSRAKIQGLGHSDVEYGRCSCRVPQPSHPTT